jgi:hypothetical protein
VSRSIAYGGSGDGAYRAENHRAGESAQNGIAGPLLRCCCHRQESQSGDTYDSKALHHFSPLTNVTHVEAYRIARIGRSDGAFKPACGKLTYPCAVTHRPERRLGLVEAIGHPAAQAIREALHSNGESGRTPFQMRHSRPTSVGKQPSPRPMYQPRHHSARSSAPVF